LDSAKQLGPGMGGSTFEIDVEGVKVFGKQLRLTELEQRPEHRMSTANIFGLPTFFQRNVGSVGFGVWRELAANAMTTGWVLSKKLESFPMMYHWRVLEGRSAAGAAASGNLADIDHMTKYWECSSIVGKRLTALADATASVVIFLEHIPCTLSAWLERQMGAGSHAIESACQLVEDGLTVDVPLMNHLGLLHGDAHFGNILTDGDRLYFADLGLATSKRFMLDPEELTYSQENASLDRSYVRANWVNWLIKEFAPPMSDPASRMAMVRSIARGQSIHQLIPGLPPSVAAVIERHANVAAVINDFYAKLQGDSRNASYPRDEIEPLLLTVASKQWRATGPEATTRPGAD